MKPEKGSQAANEETASGTKEHLSFIPPINIEPASGPIPASVEHPGALSRSSSSSLTPLDEEESRASTDTTDRDSEALGTVRSHDRRSLTSRLTGTSFKSVRKTLSFRGRKSNETSE